MALSGAFFVAVRVLFCGSVYGYGSVYRFFSAILMDGVVGELDGDYAQRFVVCACILPPYAA